MNEDVKWLFGVLLLFSVFWFASRGLNNKPSTFVIGPVINEEGGQTIRSGSGSTLIGTKVTPKNTKEEISQSLNEASQKATQIQKDLVALEESKKASSLKGKISIQSINYGQTNPAYEYIILQASQSNIQSVLLTGLRIQSTVSGRGVNIPKGVYLPFQNSVNVETPVYLAPGETAYIITGRSPLGTSFKTNKCTGFFNQYQTFNPPLPSRCPAVSSEPLTSPTNQFNDACLDYINTLPICQVITAPSNTISPECHRYVTTEINYTKCIDRHKGDRDFYDNNWRIYLGRDDILWKSRREVIELIDSGGKIIDSRTY